jgi:hypothetical protein
VTPLRRWAALGSVLGLLLLVGLWLLDSSPPPVATPRLRLPDAGPPALSAPRTTLSSHGQTFPTAIVTPTTGRVCLKGRVVNARTGAGLSGATVSASTFAGVMSATSGAEGAFELFAPAEGRLSLAEVALPGFAAFRPERDGAPIEVVLVEGVCATDLVLALEPLQRLRGSVRDEAGEAVEGAVISLGPATEPPRVVATSTAAGRFECEGFEGALVVLSREGFTTRRLLLDAKDLVSGELVIVLLRRVDGGARDGTLRGVVVDALDAGVAGALVRVRLGGDAASPVAAVEADEAGAFEATVEGAGPWVLEANLGARASLPVETSGEPVVLRLSSSARLAGRVTSGAGRPVQSFALLVRRLVGAIEGVELRPRHVVHPDGQFEVVLPEGPVEVVVAAPGLAPSSPARVTLRAEVPQRLDVTLDEGATLTGRVVDRLDRRPLPGARLSLERAEGSTLGAAALARTEADGRFRLSGLPPGLHSVLVEADGHDARLTSVEFPARGAVGPLELDLAPVPDGGAPQLELVGIGAVLKAVRDGLVFDTLVPGGGAAEAGLVVGDVVVSIDGQRASTLGFAGSIERIRGAEGSQVLLEVQRQGGALERVTVTRRRVVR